MNTNIQARYARTRLEKNNKREKKWYEESQTNHASVPCSAKWAKHLQTKQETKRKEKRRKTTNRLFPTASMHCNGEKTEPHSMSLSVKKRE